MTFPTLSYSRVWVRGRFVDHGKASQGAELQGMREPVWFDPSPPALLDATTQQIISASRFAVTPAPQDGYFAVSLLATDDPAVTPTAWTYQVTEPTGRVYHIVVPVDTPLLDAPGDPLNGQRVIDLISIVPAPSPSAGTVQLMSGRGITSMVITVDGDLVVTYTDGTVDNLGLVVGAPAELVARVDAIDVEQDTQDGRLDALEGAVAAAGGYRHTQVAPAALVQITHSLGFRPAGIRCTDTLGQPTEFASVTDPVPGTTTEVAFGAPFTGVVDLS